MADNNADWDFFLAHAGADKVTAELLYDQLVDKCRIFLDSRCLRLGDDWDTQLAVAQRRSLVTVILVSANTAAAYYQREEVAAAIALAREDPDSHRVVPIYTDTSSRATRIPYGLRLKHGISLGDDCSLAEAAARLLDLRRSLSDRGAIRQVDPPARDVPQPPLPPPNETSGPPLRLRFLDDRVCDVAISATVQVQASMAPRVVTNFGTFANGIAYARDIIEASALAVLEASSLSDVRRSRVKVGEAIASAARPKIEEAGFALHGVDLRTITERT